MSVVARSAKVGGVITGQHATATLTAPDDTTVTVDNLPLLDGTQHRIAITRQERNGTMTVRVRLTIIS